MAQFLLSSLNVWALLIGGGVASLLTYVATFGVIRLARTMGWVEKPTEGKLHTTSMPRLGGLGMYVAFVVTSLLLYAPLISAQSGTEQIFGQSYPKELVFYVLFLVASALIVAVHAYDDVRPLKPLTKLLAQTGAVLILIGPGLHNFHGVLFYGIHNPFSLPGNVSQSALPWYQRSELTLFIHTVNNSMPEISLLAIPAVLYTWFWMVGMMNAVNFIDGIDGLAAGTVAIAGLFITIISWRLGQNTVAIFAAIFTGAIVGFLPHNWSPARIWMGDSGAMFLGIGLAMLAVIGGAKFALLLIVLGIPILDVAWVAFNRIRRGQHPMQRDELPRYARQTHLHYRLLLGGLSVRQVCLVLYGATFLLGLCTLLPLIYKILSLVLVVVLMVVLLRWSTYLQVKREKHLKQEELVRREAV